LVAAAHAPAVDHGNDRDGQTADGHGETLHAVVPHGAIDPVEPLHRVEVAAGGKSLVTGAGHHRTGDRWVLASGFQCIDELVEGLLAKRVEHAGAVDGHPGDLVPDFIENVVVLSLARAAPVRCRLLGHIFFTPPVLSPERPMAELEVDALVSRA